MLPTEKFIAWLRSSMPTFCEHRGVLPSNVIKNSCQADFTVVTVFYYFRSIFCQSNCFLLFRYKPFIYDIVEIFWYDLIIFVQNKLNYISNWLDIFLNLVVWIYKSFNFHDTHFWSISHIIDNLIHYVRICKFRDVRSWW